MNAFNALDRATWPDVLTLDEVAVIVRRKVGGLRKALQNRTLVPAPAFTGPYRWRKADVTRYIDGAFAERRRA